MVKKTGVAASRKVSASGYAFAPQIETARVKGLSARNVTRRQATGKRNFRIRRIMTQNFRRALYFLLSIACRLFLSTKSPAIAGLFVEKN